jgi:hypothetical protein
MKLKIGDKIYIKKYGYLKGYETIKRVTKTIAMSENYNFNIEISENGYCRIKGQSSFYSSSGYIATKKLDEEWKNIKIINWFDNKNFTKEEKIKIYNLFNT